MNRDNYIDPEVLYSMLQKYFNGGVHKYVLGGEEGFDPYGNPITTNSQFAQGAFDSQLPVQNPFAQPSNQIQLGGSDFGTTQNTKPLVYDWQNNPKGYDQVLHSINQKPDWSKSETEYWKENPSVAGMNAPDLQNPMGGNSYTEIFDNQDGVGSKGNSGYKTVEDLMRARNDGKLTDEEFDKMREELRVNNIPISTENLNINNTAPKTGAKDGKYIDDKGRLVGGSETLSDEDKDKRNYEYMRLMNAGMGVGGMGMEGALFNLGKGLGADPGTKGKGALIATSALSSLFKGARNVASGMGVANVNREFEDWQRKQLLKRDYKSDPQDRDNNYTGGYGYSKYGGEFDGRLNTFEKGGPMESDPPVKKVNPYSTAISRINQKRFDLINAGIDPNTGQTVDLHPEGTEIGDAQRAWAAYKNSQYPEVIEDRIKEGYIPGQSPDTAWSNVGPSREQLSNDWRAQEEAKANALRQFSSGVNNQYDDKIPLQQYKLKYGGTSYDKLRQYFENGGQSMQMQGQPMQEQQAPDGTENYEIGQDVEFEYNGKMVSGKIKKIENGQIYI